MTTRPVRKRSPRPSAPSPDAGPGTPPARTVFIGTGSFGVPALEALVARPDLVTLVGVVTAPPRPAGRRGDVRRSPIQDVADARGIAPVLTPERLRAPEGLHSVLALDPSLMVLADYGQIVPPALLDLPHGALNLHPSALPRHRGASPIPATILAGDPETAVTLMRMDRGLDTGPIVATERVPLAGDEVAPALEERLARIGADVLIRALGAWLRGELMATPQPETGASLTRPLRRDDGRLDPSRSAAALERQVRAYQPWPGSWLETPAGRITVWGARAVPGADLASPGDLIRLGTGIGLATADGVLELVDVQPAGGRRMSGAALVRGRSGLVAG